MTKAKKIIKISEEQLADNLVKYLREERNLNDLYFEVYDNYEKRPIDIIVVLEDKKTWAIEVKTCLNLNVILQSIYNKKFADYCSIFIPSIYLSKLKNYEYSALRELLNRFGIGLLEWNYNNFIHETLLPTCNKEKSNSLNILENSKNSKPGIKSGKRETKFSTTVDNLIAYVKENSGTKLSIAIKNIKHHYYNDNNAINSIRTYINKNIIKELELNNGKLFVRSEYLN